MKVFISGTKRKIDIVGTIKEKLDTLMEQRADILIGDCYGVDKCVQEYLVSMDYKNVTVYVSGDKIRNNAGNWRKEHINVHRASKGFEFYRAKDVEMAKETDYGIAMWDGESKGTFVNILSLLALNKYCELYLLREKIWVRIYTAKQLIPYVGKPGKLANADTNEILKECGFSSEMREYLVNSCSLEGHDINDIICLAPISLKKKLFLLRDLKEKENLLFELFYSFLERMKCKDSFENIQIGLTLTLENSFWCSYRDILNAQWKYDDECETNTILYLFSTWYDTDVFIEKEFPCGVFCFPYQVEKYIQKEIENKDASGEDYFRLEVWQRVNARKETDELHYEHRYNLYFYNGEVCWFEEMEQIQYEDGQIYYSPKNSRYSYGDFDLNVHTPFRTGDIVTIDCHPFGPPFHALVLEAREQYDGSFPNILFCVPYTEEWRIASLKHCGFYKDAELGTYRTWLSPLYRLKYASEEEILKEDDFLMTVKDILGDDEGKAERFWTTWYEQELMDMSKEQVMELLRDI